MCVITDSLDYTTDYKEMAFPIKDPAKCYGHCFGYNIRKRFYSEKRRDLLAYHKTVPDFIATRY